MYIVSPNCDLRKLPQAATQWARQFPLSPSLPNFLAELSVAPRPYKLHCPSKAHRPVYMAMLAWLMRGGWVTQLCTFAYVVVWPEIIYEVEHALEAEEIARAKRGQNQGREPGSVESDDTTALNAAATSSVAALGDATVAGFGSGFLPLNFDPPDLTSSTTTSLRDLSLSHSQSSLIPTGTTSQPTSPISTRNQPQNNNHSPSPPPPPQSHHHNHHHHHHNNNSDNDREPEPEPTPAEQAAEKARLARIADKAARELAERATAHARKTPPRPTAHPSVNHARHLDGITPHVILDANKATGKESLYLSAIGRRFQDLVKGGNTSSGGGGAGSAGGRGVNPPPGQPQGQGQGQGQKDRGGGSGIGGVRDGGGEWEERVAKAWPVFCKYFNGRSALERIALQEDMKRKDVWNLLTAMSEYLLCVRHW
jgi:hypothetical protein